MTHARRSFARNTGLLLLALVCVGGAGHAPALAASLKSPKFRVLTYNIRIGMGSDRPSLNPYKARNEYHDVSAIVRAIASTRADVVALQEVLGRTQAKSIASALGMRVAYVRHGIKSTRHGYWWGLALLSRFPISDVRRVPISTGRGNTRSNLVATLRIGGRSVQIINIHKDKDGRDGSALHRTMESLQGSKHPVILLGDLNIRPHDRRLRILAPHLEDAAAVVRDPASRYMRRQSTFHRGGKPLPDKRIDYILVDPQRIDVRRMRLMSKTHWLASDHIGVIADLRLK